jgi:hypothetical protein
VGEDHVVTTLPEESVEPKRARRRSPVVLFVLALVVGIAALVCLVVGIAGFAANGTEEDELQRIAVPGDGTFEVDEAGPFTIFYESSTYVDEGVCERRTRRINDRTRTYLVCEEDLLQAAAPAPVVRPEGGDSIAVADAGGTIAAFDLDEHLPVWSFTAEEAGTYEIDVPDAPLGTETVAIGRDGGRVPAWAAWLLVLSLALGFAAVVLFVLAVVLALVRASRRKAPGGGPPPPPPATGWAPPSGAPVPGPARTPDDAPGQGGQAF